MYGHNRLLTNNYSPALTTLSDAVLDYPTIENGKFRNILVNGTNIRSIGGGTNIWKVPVSIVSNINTALSGAYNGDLTTIGKRILLINQNNPIQNGIYVVASGNWQRAVDLLAGDSAAGIFVLYTISINNYFTYLCTNSVPTDIVGINNIFFEINKVGYPAGGNNGETQIHDRHILSQPSTKYFRGEPKLTYSVNDLTLEAMLTIGNLGESYIITNQSSGIPFRIISAKDLYINIQTNSLFAGFNLAAYNTNMNLSNFSTSVIQSVFSPGSININFTNNINITSTSNLEIDTGDLTTIIDDHGVKLANLSYNQPGPESTHITTYQGFITITGITIAPGESTYNEILLSSNTKPITSNNIVFVKLIDYNGLGIPYLKVNSVTDTRFSIIIYNLDSAHSINGIKFSYNIL
jgi:hypothetical protein